MTYFEISIISIAVFGSAVIKNGIGIGAGIFLLPFLALVLPPKIALGFGAPAMIISDLVGVKNYWGEWNSKELIILIPFAAIGVVFGTYLVKIIPDTSFKQGVAVFALVFSSIHLINIIMSRYSGGKNKDVIDRNSSGGSVFSALFGFLGGTASTVAHAGGLMMSVYLLQKKANPRMFVGTFVLLFAFINLCKIFAYSSIGIIDKQVIILVAVLSPVIIVGGAVGNLLNKKFSQRIFRLTVLIMIFFIGLRLYLTI